MITDRRKINFRQARRELALVSDLYRKAIDRAVFEFIRERGYRPTTTSCGFNHNREYIISLS